MVFLRGVEAALGVMLLVDFIKTVTRHRLPRWVKYLLIMSASVGGALAVTPPGAPWRTVVATSFVAMGTSALIHEVHSTLSTFVDANIRAVLIRGGRGPAPAPTARRSSRQMPSL